MKQNDKNIKEIRIYHSLWKNILLTVGCFAFAAGGYFILHDANTSWPTKVFGGIGSMVFFGCGGMLMFMINGSLKFEITAKRLYAASQRVL